MSNPFDDPDVQAAATGGGAQQNGNVYGGGGAYGDSNTASTANDAQQQVAVAVGGAMADQAAQQATREKDAVKQDYAAQSAQQADHHSAPARPNWCSSLMAWLPIRYVAWIGAICLVIIPVVDWIVFASKMSFVYVIVGGYLIFFGVIATFVESPIFKLTRKPQLAIFFWFRLLSRMWGRAWFYFFVSILCFIEIRETITIGFFVGIYLFAVALLMLIISRQSATKYRRMFDFIAAGTDPENEDELAGKFTRKFDEMDLDQDGKIGSLEIVKLSEQAGRRLSNAERHAIQTFLDANCNGSVARDDFVNQFMNYNLRIKWL